MAIIQASIYSESLMRAVPITALIPVEYQSGKMPFKTLYLLHGLTGSNQDWLANTNVHRWARERGLAVIMPSCDNSYYVNGQIPKNDYGDFVGKELVDLTRALFPLSAKREDTFIAGMSMGGFGALRTAFANPDTFSCVAAYSAALHILKIDEVGNIGAYQYADKLFGDYQKAKKSDMNPEVLIEQIAKRAKEDKDFTLPKVYISCGTKDVYYSVNTPVRDKLKKLGFDVTWNEADYGHDWDFWDEEILNTLNWLPIND